MAPPPLLTLRDVTLGYGGNPLFRGVELFVGAGERVCLVGRNGSGKSTLLKVIAGLVEPEGGEIFVQPGTRIAYLPQEPDVTGFATVHDYVCSGLHGELEHATYLADRLIEGLNLSPDSDPSVLSGGEKRRAAIAQALVGEPDILLLDEPTNHLDMPTIQWLEEELASFRGAFVTISHDRSFLSRLTRVTLWLDRGVVRRSDKGFSNFETWSDEILEREAIETAKFDKLIAEEVTWSRQGIKARRTRNEGRMARLQDMRKERSEMVARVGLVKMEVESGPMSGKLVVEATDISKRYGDRDILLPFSTRILRGDRVGIIGPNGAGKSTLLKMLTGSVTPDSGTVRIGTNLEIIHLDQNRSALDPVKTIWETLADSGGDSINVRGRLRHVVSYMRDFLFDEKQARSPVGSLSGGERNRLLLAKAIARPSNLMILDEPTNDLDMETLDLLQDLLSDYDGTLLLVSHDRDFLDRVVTSTIAFEGSGVAREYPGGYADYERQRQQTAVQVAVAAKAAAAQSKPKSQNNGKLNFKQQRALQELPKDIAKMEAEIVVLERKMADGSFFTRDPAGFNKAVTNLDTTRSLLAKAEEEWLALEMLREEIEGK